ncbi:MAG: ADP-ribosylation family protein, partial [Gemmataceae bacterium]
PLAPLEALSEPLGLVLVGPFEVMAGRFDGRVPRRSLLLHWRFYGDPPEFFTLFAGEEDGPHFGYFLDDPPQGECCVASYFPDSPLEWLCDGDDLFEAIRLYLEHRYALASIQTDESGESDLLQKRHLEALDRLREKWPTSAEGPRPEKGEDYISRYEGHARRLEKVLVKTREGMGVVAEPAKYRAPHLRGRALWKELRRKQVDLSRWREEAMLALSEGYPATTLELGRNLWLSRNRAKTALGAELLEAAYAMLGRDVLRRVVQAHQAERYLPMVDILEEENP